MGALAGVSSARMRGDGQSPLYLRAPMKALSPVGSMSALRQHTKGPPGAQGGMRRVQSPGPTNGAAYSGCRSAAVARQTPGRGVTPTSPSSRGRLPQTPRRYLTIFKIRCCRSHCESYLKLRLFCLFLSIADHWEWPNPVLLSLMNPGKMVVTETLRTPPIILTVKSNTPPMTKKTWQGKSTQRP